MKKVYLRTYIAFLIVGFFAAATVSTVAGQMVPASASSPAPSGLSAAVLNPLNSALMTLDQVSSCTDKVLKYVDSEMPDANHKPQVVIAKQISHDEQKDDLKSLAKKTAEKTPAFSRRIMIALRGNFDVKGSKVSSVNFLLTSDCVLQARSFEDVTP